MANQLIRRVARVDKGELSGLPSDWTDRERGRYLRGLLSGKGIDPRQFFRVEYYPLSRCWLVIQETYPSSPAPSPAGPKDETFFTEASAEFRRVARAAFASWAARSTHFACCGQPYLLPEEPRPLLPAELVNLLGPEAGNLPPVRFDSQGGWKE
jgi:hypothetical protein